MHAMLVPGSRMWIPAGGTQRGTARRPRGMGAGTAGRRIIVGDRLTREATVWRRERRSLVAVVVRVNFVWLVPATPLRYGQERRHGASGSARGWVDGWPGGSDWRRVRVPRYLCAEQKGHRQISDPACLPSLHRMLWLATRYVPRGLAPLHGVALLCCLGKRGSRGMQREKKKPGSREGNANDFFRL